MQFPYHPPQDYLYSEDIRMRVVDASDKEVAGVSRLDVNISLTRSSENKKRIRSGDGIDVGSGMREYVFGLDSRWESWFTVDPSVLRDEVEALLEDPNSEWHSPWMLNVSRSGNWEWDRLDWPILGRGLAAAVLNHCKGSPWLQTKSGRDRDYSREILHAKEIHEQIHIQAKQLGMGVDDWLPDRAVDTAIEHLISQRIDPSSDLARVDDGPFRPMFSQGGQTRINPLASRLRNRIYQRKNVRGSGGEDISDVFGVCLLEVVDQALDELEGGDRGGFALLMHGLTAYIVARSRLSLNKIGMHLFASLGLRRELRGVRYLSVPAIHSSIDSQFPLMRCLEVLHEHSITCMYYVDKS